MLKNLLLLTLITTSAAWAVPNPDAIDWDAPAVPFVVSLYEGVLGRTPGPADSVGAWAANITANPNTRLRVFRQIAASPEGRSRLSGGKSYSVYYRIQGQTLDWFFARGGGFDASRNRKSGPWTYGYAKALVGYYRTYSYQR